MVTSCIVQSKIDRSQQLSRIRNLNLYLAIRISYVLYETVKHNMNYIRLFQTNQQLNGWEYSLESYVFSRGMTVDVNISLRLWFNVSVAHEIPEYSRFFMLRWVNIWAIQSHCTTTRASKITMVTKITVIFKRSENRNHHIRVTHNEGIKTLLSGRCLDNIGFHFKVSWNYQGKIFSRLSLTHI